MTSSSARTPGDNGEAAKVQNIEVLSHMIAVSWQDGHISPFHFIWLRDNCSCAQCLHPDTHERVSDILQIDLDIKPYSVSQDDGFLTIVWTQDRHRSSYDLSWLRQHCYSDAAKAERRHLPELWTSDLVQKLPEIEYEQVMKDDAGLRTWLIQMRDYGLTLYKEYAKQ